MVHSDLSGFIVTIARNNTNGVQLLGTGFVVGEGLIATTKHVTNGDESNLHIIMPKYNLSDYQDTSDKQVNIMTAEIFAIDPIKDICILKIQASVTPPYRLIGTDNVQPGTSVVVFGYPHANYGRFVLTQQNTQIGAKILIDSYGIKSKHIVLNTQARPGQSGGPIFDSSFQYVIGMLMGSYVPGEGGISLGGIDPHTLHQTTHVISSEYIMEMI
ncbi:S1 family peptidase [Bacillus subtilis]|uniref:S1 family peptidase n=1 Tax=Bacillus subtilis TaxID=1423 RepID=A0AC61Z2V3_BACIU|nr:serine protease [Bacillus subtilis]